MLEKEDRKQNQKEEEGWNNPPSSKGGLDMFCKIDKSKGIIKPKYATQTTLDCKVMSMEGWIKANVDKGDYDEINGCEQKNEKNKQNKIQILNDEDWVAVMVGTRECESTRR